MKYKLIKAFIIMTILVLISGTLLHFVYEWSGNSPIVGAFSAVNESTWEHLKLAFYPMLLFGIISYFSIRYISNNFIEGLTIGILVALLFIVVFFYGYQLILGSDYFLLDILDFILGVIIGELAFYKVVSMDNYSNFYTRLLCITIILGLLLCFVTFTFITPRHEIFRDPVHNSYGIVKN
ncbi:MAG: hypothetical protein HFJ17_02020 [Clostridia bacterium]|nr:hypothetical protein [Clostridia bacterium]